MTRRTPLLRRPLALAALATLSFALVLLAACGDEPAGPLSAFQPEIINSQDAFQFQVTNAQNVTTTVSYAWQNSGAQATINHSSVVGAGNAVLTVLDADGTQVYTHDLVASLNEPSASGTPGQWTVSVTLINCSGTLNFRAEKL